MAYGNKLAKNQQEQQQDKTLINLVGRMGPGIKRALPGMIRPERFIRVTVSAISGNKDLQACTESSFLGALMNAAQLGLEPNTPIGQAYLIPYAGKCQFQIGYKGMIELAARSGVTVQAHEVKEGDQFTYEYGLEPILKHKPAMKNRGETIMYYAVWRSKDAFGFEVMSKEDMLEFKKKFVKAKDGPWNDNFDAMAKKTVIKRALKYAPLSVEAGNAIAADETVKNVSLEDITKDYFDISLVQAEKVEADKETGEIIDAEVVEQKPKAKKQAANTVPPLPPADMPEPVDPGESLI